ncbi:hypothetical protein TRVL_08096 [Trypanosoma vivax]|nr:hypothetical protein TRVL_08096 [Trypanosoma vivax]
MGPVVFHTLVAPSRALPIKKDNTVSTHRVERNVAAIGRNLSPVVRDDVSIPFSDLQERRTWEVLESPRGSSRGCHSPEPLPCETALDILQRMPKSSGLLAQRKPLPLGKLVPVQTQLLPKNLSFQMLQKKKRLFEL